MATQAIFQERHGELSRLVRGWDRRLRFQQMFAWLPRCLLPGLVIGVAIAVISRLRPWLMSGQILLISGILLALGFAVMLIAVWLWPRPRLAAARRFDVLFGLQERVSTALELIDGRIRSNDELLALQVDDAWTTARDVRPAEALPLIWRWREWSAVLLLAVVLILLLIIPNPQEAKIAENAAQRAAIDAAAEQLRQITEDVAADAALEPKDRDQLLQALQTSTNVLQQPGVTPEEAFATLSDSQAALQEKADNLNQQASAGQSALQAASDALGDLQQVQQQSQQQNTQDAAQAAQSALNNLSQNLSSMNQAQQQQAAQALQQASQALQQSNPNASQAMQQAAQSLQNGNPSQAQQSLNQASSNIQQAQQTQQNQQSSAQQLNQSAQSVQQSANQVGQQGQQNQQNGQQGQQNQQNGQQGQQNQQNGQQNQVGQQGQQNQQNGQQGQQGQAGQQGLPQAGQNGQPGNQQGQQGQAGQQGNQGQQGQQGQPGQSGSVSQPDGQTGQSPPSGNGGGAGDSPGDAGSDQQGQAGQSGPISQNNNPDGQGVGQYDPVYAPQRIGGQGDQQIQLNADDGNTPVQEGDFANNPNGNVTVPYDQVYSDYSNAANRALQSDYIPLGLRDVVHDYFSSLEPGQSGNGSQNNTNGGTGN